MTDPLFQEMGFNKQPKDEASNPLLNIIAHAGVAIYDTHADTEDLFF